MKNYLILPVLTPILFSAAGAHAEVTLDGTLGHAGALPGPDYQIGADVGQPHGGNLFHSFQDFNLQSHESATFSGPTSVSNIIGRVTGGNPSNIDGLISSTIPNADLYFLNPYGILFGPNAKLDVQGGFHASTADELRFQDGTTFNARTPPPSTLLSVAPIQAFGFLTDTPAAIHLQDSLLSVPEGHTFSLIGGELELKGDVLKDEQGMSLVNGEVNFLKFPTYAYTAGLKTPSGRINLASVASRGEVTLSINELSISAAQRGNITLNHAEVQTSGQGSGNIFVRGANLALQDGRISNTVTGQQAGGVIDINAHDILVAGSLTSSGITAENKGSGHGSEIRVAANNLELRGGSINTSVYDRGPGGNITVHVADKIKLHNPTPELFKFAGIYSDTYGMQEDAGNGGNIQVEAGQIEIQAASTIATASYGRGNTGDTRIKAHGDILLTGTAMVNGWSHNAAIATSSYLGSAFTKSFGREGKGGNSGHLVLEAQKLTISDLGLIVGDAYSGDAGQTDIHAQEINILSGGGIAYSTFAEGKGGTLSITTQRLNISENLPTRKYPSGIYSDSVSSEANAGAAGDIKIQADVINVLDNSVINSSTQHAMGGNIHISVNSLLYLQGGKVTTSVAGGIGSGGNITIDRPQFLVLDKGQIKAQADAGHGGNIRISAQQFLKTPDSLISASSRLGLDGQVLIDSPAETISGSLLTLTTTFTEVSHLLPRLCTALSFEEFIHRSRFLVNRIAGSPPRPDDLKPSSLLLPITAAPNFTEAIVSKEKKAESTQRLAWLTGCHR